MRTALGLLWKIVPGTVVGVLLGLYAAHWVISGTILTAGKQIHYWQELIGAFIGAATPIGWYVWQQKREQSKKHKDYLVLLEKNLVLAINNLADIDKMLHQFMSGNFSRFKQRVYDENNAGRHSAGQTFVPLSASFVLDKDLLKESTESNYLDNLILETIALSHELPQVLGDINRQFDRTISLNAQIGMMKLNAPKSHNAIFLENLREFESFIWDQIFGNNIPVYLKTLMSARVALQQMIKLGYTKWVATFDHFSHLPADQRQIKIAEYFKEDINDAIKKIQPEFKSELKLVS